jgi:glycosyltransferase involved in cell wall biosynthesis
MNPEKPLVSVIIPCYNAVAFIKKAILSVTAQSYKDLEIIVVNDCSVDSSLSILKQLQAQDDRIKILENEKNIGISQTLNKGIENSNGNYIARMDADDICFETRIEKQVAFLEAHKDVAICGGNYVRINEHGKVTGRIKFPTEDNELKAELFFYCPFAHPAVMIRKTALYETGLYAGYIPAEDYELWLRMAEKFRLANIPADLIYYRMHDSNTTITQKNKLFTALTKAIKDHEDTYGFTKDHLHLHLKFLEGTWYQKTTTKELREIKNWKKELLSLHANNPALEKTFNKYISLAMLSILKSRQNTLKVKSAAAAKLLTINPAITIKHFLR